MICVRCKNTIKAKAMSKDTKLYIRNMCCSSCISIVNDLLLKAGLTPKSVSLGEVVLKGTLAGEQTQLLNKKLSAKGFCIVRSLKETTVIKIKTSLLEYLNNVLDHNERRKLSAYIENRVGHSYNYLSRLFSETEKITIERYLLLLKTEKAKELLSQGEMTISNIAYSLGYSCSQSFSTQFKRTTKRTPLQFKQAPAPARKHLNRL